MKRQSLTFLNRYLSTGKSKNYYDILGLNKDATSTEIKSAFVNLSKKLHPDMNPNIKAEDFIKLNEAYSILIKPATRQVYDNQILSNNLYHNEDLNSNLDDLAEQIRRHERNREEFYSKYGINKNYYNPKNSSQPLRKTKASTVGLVTLVIVFLGFIYPFVIYFTRFKSGLYSPFSYQDQQALYNLRKSSIDAKNKKKLEQLKANNSAYKID